MYFPHQTLDWHIYLRSLRYLWGSRERSPDYDEVRVGKQVWSVVWYIFRKDLPNRRTIQGPLFSSCSLDFQSQIYSLLAVDKFGPNSGWKIVSAEMKGVLSFISRGHWFFIFVLCFWINIALRLMNVFRFTHSHKYTHKWKQQRKKQFLFEFCSFYEFVQSLFCTLILFPARFLFYTSYKMDIWGKLMPFHTRFVVIDAVRNLDIDFLVFLDSSMSFILFFIINGVSLAMSNSCWNCL